MGKRIIVFALIFMLSFTGGTQKKNGTQDNSAAIDKSPDKSAALRDGGITQPLPEPASASHPTAVPLSVPEHPSGGMPGEKPPEEIPVEVLISFAGDCTIGTDESFSYVNSFPYRFEKVGGDYSYFFKGVRSDPGQFGNYPDYGKKESAEDIPFQGRALLCKYPDRGRC